MPAEIAQRVARWHPAILTSAIVFAFLAQGSWSGAALPPVLRGVLVSLPLAATCGWLWAIFQVSRRASLTPLSPYRAWVFAVPPAVAFAAGFENWPTDSSPASAAIFLSLLVGLIWAAQALENVDAANGAAPLGRILGTLLLMFLAPVGVWVLHLKILRVASRSSRISVSDAA